MMKQLLLFMAGLWILVSSIMLSRYAMKAIAISRKGQKCISEIKKFSLFSALTTIVVSLFFIFGGDNKEVDLGMLFMIFMVLLGTIPYLFIYTNFIRKRTLEKQEKKY